MIARLGANVAVEGLLAPRPSQQKTLTMAKGYSL